MIAIIAILAGMLLPALAKAKTKAQGIACINNLKQLQLGWILYADDSQDQMPGVNGGSAPGPGQWVSGWLDFAANNVDNTNLLYLLDPQYAQIGPYLKSPGSTAVRPTRARPPLAGGSSPGCAASRPTCG